MGRKNRSWTVEAERIALCTIIIAMCKKKKDRREKKQWCKKWLENRATLGSHVTLLRELQSDHHRDFHHYMRMDPDTFYRLLAKAQHRIEKQDTNMRDFISALARLEATLLFLSTGASYSSLQYSTRISKQSFSQIVPDTCQAIYDELKDEYLQVMCVVIKTINPSYYIAEIMTSGFTLCNSSSSY